MKTKLFFSIIAIMVIFAMGCTSPNKNETNEVSEIDFIIRPQDFGNGVFYFDTYAKSGSFEERMKESFGKSISHFIQHNPEWKISDISPLTRGGQISNEIIGYFVICEAVKYK